MSLEGFFFKSSLLSTFTAHRSCSHKFSTLDNFRPKLLVQHTLSLSVVEEDFVSDTEEIYVSNCVPEAEPELENGKAIQNHLGSLFLRMQTLFHISNTAVQEIIDKLFEIGEFAHQNIKTVIEKVLKDNNCIADASVVTSLTDEIQTLNPLKLLSREGPFGTEYKRQSFYGKNFTVIEPVEYLLSAQEKTYFCLHSYFRFAE